MKQEMKTIKIIDLLNKIANGEEVPQFVKIRNRLTHKFENMFVCQSNIVYKLDTLEIDLNDEVEIIEDIEIIEDEEDKKIEKIGSLLYCETTVESILHRKIDEIIDRLNEMDKGE